MSSDKTSTEEADDSGTSRRSILKKGAAGLAGAAGLSYVGYDQFIDNGEPTFAASANFSSNDLLIETTDGDVSSMALEGTNSEIIVDYDNFHHTLSGAADEFNVNMDMETDGNDADFSGGREQLVSGALDVGTTPHDTVSAFVADSVLAGGSVDIANHSEVTGDTDTDGDGENDEYQEFEPGSDQNEEITNLTFYVQVDSSTYALSASDSVPLSVTVTNADAQVDVGGHVELNGSAANQPA